MNTNLLNIVKQIIAEYGEAVLADPARLKAFFSDLAKDEPKPLRIAFGRCIEAGAYAALKETPDAAERAGRKAIIVQKVREEHGLDMRLCGEALDILEAALPPVLPEEKAAARPTEEDRARDAITNGEPQSEETGDLQKTISKQNEEIIRCVQELERLSAEINKAYEERQKKKAHLRAAI